VDYAEEMGYDTMWWNHIKCHQNLANNSASIVLLSSLIKGPRHTKSRILSRRDVEMIEMNVQDGQSAVLFLAGQNPAGVVKTYKL
jgi:hypothetical protein